MVALGFESYNAGLIRKIIISYYSIFNTKGQTFVSVPSRLVFVWLVLYLIISTYMDIYFTLCISIVFLKDIV